MSFFPKNMIVVPVDFSEESLAAVDLGLELVDHPAHLVVIHVQPDVTFPELAEMWDDSQASEQHRKAEQALADRFPGEKYQDLRFEVALGDPGSQIVQTAEKHHAELIVMPSHGRAGLSHLLIGSVAERVTRLAHCPVLVLRGEASTE
jgi:nucleotide-binding universal stress UspA family protein